MRKKLANNQKVAHIWAEQNQETGYASNFYFDGPTIYSYGSHFPIATFIDDNTVLFTTSSYSITTSKHINLARQALPTNIKVFYVPYILGSQTPDDRHIMNYLAYRGRVLEYAKKAIKARTNTDYWISKMHKTFRESIQYHNYFKIDHRRFLLPDFEILADEIRKIKQQKRENTKLWKTTMLKRKKRWEKGFDTMENGDFIITAYFRNFTGTDLLRIHRNNKNTTILESSNGNKVAIRKRDKFLPIALKILNWSNECKKNNRCYIPSNFEERLIDFYRVKSIDEKGTVHIGCSKFSNETINRIAKELGLET